MTKLTRIRELILGLAMIAFALVLFLTPESGSVVILVILGVGLVVSGVGTLIFYLTMARHMVGGKKIFYRGILLLDLGALLLSGYSGSEQLIRLYLLGLFAISGVIDIIRALELRKQGAPWKHRVIGGAFFIAILILGLIYKSNPHTVVYVFCIGLIYLGVTRIVSVFRKTAVLYIPE